MKIAYLVSALSAGGAERVTVELANAFANAGHDVTIFVGWPSTSEAPARARLGPEVDVQYIRASRPGISTRYLGAAWWAWNNCGRLSAFDVVHCHLTYGAFIGCLLGVWRSLTGSSRPVIIETYHAVGMRISPVLRWLHSQMATRRDVLVLMASDPYWSRFTRRHPRLAVRTVLNGASAPDVEQMDRAATSAYRSSLGIPGRCRLVAGSVGFLRSDRQPEVFLPIISRLVQEFGEDVHWIFAGDGPEQGKLEALAAAAGISRQVHFAGFVAEVHKPLSVIDLFLTISVGHVSGVAAMEAALAGRPVVGVQSLPDYVAGPDDWIWSSPDPQAVADKAVRLLRNPDERTALGERQRQYARLNHSVDAMARSYLEIYESALSVASEARLAANATVGR